MTRGTHSSDEISFINDRPKDFFDNYEKAECRCECKDIYKKYSIVAYSMICGANNREMLGIILEQYQSLDPETKAKFKETMQNDKENLIEAYYIGLKDAEITPTTLIYMEDRFLPEFGIIIPRCQAPAQEDNRCKGTPERGRSYCIEH